jgi:hypothetical protein
VKIRASLEKLLASSLLILLKAIEKKSSLVFIHLSIINIQVFYNRFTE